jgi:lysozyme family protein
MIGNFKNCLALLLKSEGGFTDKLGDGEKWTNMGVTNTTWSEWTGHEATEKEMRNLTIDQIRPLYEQRYWRSAYCEVLPRGLDFLVFSMAVNAGPGRAVKLLQQSIGCIPDGTIGPRTIAQITNTNIDGLITKYSESRKDYYIGLNKPQFIDGWLKRVQTEKAEAESMANS